MIVKVTKHFRETSMMEPFLVKMPVYWQHLDFILDNIHFEWCYHQFLWPVSFKGLQVWFESYWLLHERILNFVVWLISFYSNLCINLVLRFIESSYKIYFYVFYQRWWSGTGLGNSCCDLGKAISNHHSLVHKQKKDKEIFMFNGCSKLVSV